MRHPCCECGSEGGRQNESEGEEQLGAVTDKSFLSPSAAMGLFESSFSHGGAFLCFSAKVVKVECSPVPVKR